MPIRAKSCYYGVYLGTDAGSSASVDIGLKSADASGCDFIVVDLARSSMERFEDYIDIRGVSSETMGSSVVGRVRNNNNGTISNAVQEQIEWATHAGMYAVVLDMADFSLPHLASIVRSFSLKYPAETSPTRIWISCTTADWLSWDKLRTITNYPSKLSVFLHISFAVDHIQLGRWLGEPISAFSVMDGWDDEFILQLMRMNAQPVCNGAEEARRIRECLSSSPVLTEAEEFVAPYHDCLQLPLQPLADDMDNGVYETFETDRIKYTLYERAILKRLNDLTNDSGSSLHIAVVGAGRGGLVDSTLRAIRSISHTDTNTYIISVVEKNRNAVRTLQYRRRDDPLWNDPLIPVTISVISSDMRGWNPAMPVDILVSELLGSLGDNEASPECIDSVIQHVRGVSIPSSYFSSLEPVTAHRAWLNIRERQKLQCPLVVYLHNVFRPCNPQKLFEFRHVPGEIRPRDKSQVLSWKPDVDVTIHGFAGYFESCLYSDVIMSIHPPSQTQNMVSWFPGFLPLTTPVHVCAGQILELLVERHSSSDKMWIEWTVLSPTLQPTENARGLVHSVGL
jgi:type II protein arginine methyltransferase